MICSNEGNLCFLGEDLNSQTFKESTVDKNYLCGAVFENCILDGTVFEGMILEDVNFENCSMHNVTFKNCTLKTCKIDCPQADISFVSSGTTFYNNIFDADNVRLDSEENTILKDNLFPKNVNFSGKEWTLEDNQILGCKTGYINGTILSDPSGKLM